MAKQTYTTGQVLTAAQMTTLQTNDFNQTVSAKTASYTLVAADAGTRITMSNASATTVTVDTNLFTAGDTLEITNIGAGICTVTAGTATVSTSSTLALKQFDTGQLYFTSTGVAIFFMADAADASGGGLTSIASGTFSSSSTLISGIPGTYKQLLLLIDSFYLSTSGWGLYLRLNDDSTANRYFNVTAFANTTASAFNAAKIELSQDNFGLTTAGYGTINCLLPNYASTTSYKQAIINAVGTGNSSNPTFFTYQANGGVYNQLTAITSMRINNGAGATQNGNYVLYGVS